MYKQPSKRTQRFRLFTLYSLMTVTVLAVVAILVLIVSNYGFNRETGTLEQRGLVQFASTPSGAMIAIDGSPLSGRTPTKHSVDPGEHLFTVDKEGYEQWKLTTPISTGSLVWLNYVRLVPKDRTTRMIGSYAALMAASPSPDKKTILLQPDKTKPSFRLVDISRDDPTGKVVVLPASLYKDKASDDEITSVHEFTVGGWDQSGRYVLVWSLRGDKKELIVFDTQNPAKSVNVSREFSLPITQAKLSGRSGNILYVVTDGNLRKVDIAGGTVSRSLVGDVVTFSLYDTNTIAYTTMRSVEDSSVVRTAGVYREGDESPVALRTSSSRDVSLSIATTVYYGTTYTAIANGKQIGIYKGHYDNGVDGLVRVATKTLDADVVSIEFNESGSYVVARSETSFTSFGLERQIFTTVHLDKTNSKDLFWLDAMHLGLVQDGQLTMRDVDGTNMHNLMAVRSGYKAVLSKNGTYLYGIGSDKDDVSVRLQRVRMILK